MATIAAPGSFGALLAQPFCDRLRAVFREKVRSLAKELLPPVVIRATRSLRPRPPEPPGHRGNYDSFADALAACGTAGGEEKNVVDTVAGWTHAIRDRAGGGRALPLDDRSLQNLAALLIALQGPRRDDVRVLDFGGALGGLYYQLRDFVPRRRSLSWVVSETPTMAERGTRDFATDELSFVSDVAALKGWKPDIIIASGSLQCVPDPPATLKALSLLADHLILNRIPLVAGSTDRLTIHHVDPTVYAARVPNWFFGESLWLSRCQELGFEVVLRWGVPQDVVRLDGQPISFSGMLWSRSANRPGAAA